MNSTFIKRTFTAAAEIFVFSSLFLALCAVGMGYQTVLLFHLPSSTALALFTFAGTLCSYSFHWYFTPHSFGGSRKTAWSVRHKKLHAALFCIGLSASVYAGWLLREHWLLLLITASATFLYSAPKIPHRAARLLQKIAVGKTIFLAAAWAHVTALLPLLLHRHPLSNTEIIFVLNRFFFIYAICILFDYRDRESDRREGIRSLLTTLEHRGIRTLFWGTLTFFFASCCALYASQFTAAQVAALLLPGVAVGALWPFAIRHSGDYFYYFMLDGLMALSLPLLYFFNYAGF